MGNLPGNIVFRAKAVHNRHMSEDEKTVKKKIACSYNTILTSKFRKFKKRSFRNYTFSCLLYSIGITVVRGGVLLSLNTLMVFITFFLSVMSLAMIMIFGSAWYLARKHGDNSSMYTFSADGIHIQNEVNRVEENLGWDWIRSYEITNKALFLQTDTKKTFEIILDKEKISKEETDLLISWFESSR